MTPPPQNKTPVKYLRMLLKQKQAKSAFKNISTKMNFSIYEVMVLSFVTDLLEEQNNVLVSIFKNIQRKIYKIKVEE